MKIEIVKLRYLWFSISALLIIATILCVAFLGMNLGIDFTGGSLVEVRFSEQVAAGDVRATLSELGYENSTVQTTGEQDYLIRLENLDEETHQSLLSSLNEKHGELEEMRFDSIGPVIGEELKKKSLTGLVVVLVLIGLYIAWAFRQVSEPVASWKYAVLTLLAALHDVIIPVGVFSILGHFYGWEVGTAFVAAILTILGYSINDTIVVFDRTRENLMRKTGKPFSEIVEASLKQTIRRSLNTSLTTLLALLAIFFFGGDTTKPFALALIVGIIAGTYSSIFIASPLLVEWEKWRNR